MKAIALIAAILALSSRAGRAEGYNDVGPVRGSTASDSAISIGRPRGQVQRRTHRGFAIRVARGYAVSDDGPRLLVWDLKSGEVIHTLAPVPRAQRDGFFVVSDDGNAIAFSVDLNTYVYTWPFDHPATQLSCWLPTSFSTDDKLLACDGANSIEIWDIGRRKSIAKMDHLPHGPRSVATAFPPEGRALFVATSAQLMRWTFDTSTVGALIYSAPEKIGAASFLISRGIATLDCGEKRFRVDLATGQVTRSKVAALDGFAPSGALVVDVGYEFVKLLDAAGKTTWSTKVLPAAASQPAFGEDNHTFGFIENEHLRIFEVGGGERHFDAPSRFAGWIGPGVAAIEHGGAYAAFTPETRAWTALPNGPGAMKPAAAPAWATWVGDGPPLAAEPSKRHETPAMLRSTMPCQPKLRVWSPAGVRTLTMSCAEIAEHENPGWAIGGGRVLAISMIDAWLYDPATGKVIAKLPAGERKLNQPQWAQNLWAGAVAPTAGFVAFVMRRADLGGAELDRPAPDPREDAVHATPHPEELLCDGTIYRPCDLEYFVQLWRLDGGPWRAWQIRVEESDRDGFSRPVPASGAIAFDHESSRVLVGLADGDVWSTSTAAGHATSVIAAHDAPVVRIAVSPDDAWVFTEDAAGEQRLWRLPAATK